MGIASWRDDLVVMVYCLGVVELNDFVGGLELNRELTMSFQMEIIEDRERNYVSS